MAEEPGGLHIDAQMLLNALPFFAMIIDADHHVLEANTLFVRECADRSDTCPISCYPIVHGTRHPHPDCPLVESVRTGAPVVREIIDPLRGGLLVSVYPMGPHPVTGVELFLHFAQPL